MSRVGKMLIKIPEKVKVRSENGTVFVEGPKGKLQFTLPSLISVEIKDGEISFKRANEEQKTVALHGTARALVNNMVVGVSKGFSKILDIIGVGYKAEAKGRELVLAMGYSHPVIFPLPEGVEAKVDKQTRITVSGCNRQQVCQVAAKIREIRLPEPYKGKGIRYEGEYVRHKVGKAAVGAGT